MSATWHEARGAVIGSLVEVVDREARPCLDAEAFIEARQVLHKARSARCACRPDRSCPVDGPADGRPSSDDFLRMRRQALAMPGISTDEIIKGRPNK